MALATLFAIFALGLLLGLLGLPALHASFVAGAFNGGNTLTTDTLDPPSGLTAGDGPAASLVWAATPDPYAAGYRVLRAATSGGPYSQIATVTPRATTSYVDTAAVGTYYYVVRAFFQNWESGDSNENIATVADSCAARDTGFLNPGTEAAATGGDDDGFELNPTNAFADDSSFASNLDGAGDRQRYFDFGINVPPACAVRGIDVRVDWWLDDTKTSNTLKIELSWDGGVSWTLAQSDGVETASEHTAILGGASDTWGRTWSALEISDANFRVRVSTDCSGAPGQCNKRDYFLDWLAVQVAYGP